jgi:hypothetical protein
MDVIWLEFVYDVHPGCEVNGTAMGVTGTISNDTVDEENAFVNEQPTVETKKKQATRARE